MSRNQPFSSWQNIFAFCRGSSDGDGSIKLQTAAQMEYLRMIALLPLGVRRHTRAESGPVPSPRKQNTRRLPQRQREEPGFSFLCLSPRQRGQG